MSVIPRQEVPGRWLLFNVAIIVTIVWIDNHAHYRERDGKKKGRKLEALRPLGPGWGDGRGRGGPQGCVLPPGCMGKLVCESGLHLIWVSQGNYLGWCFQGEE